VAAGYGSFSWWRALLALLVALALQIGVNYANDYSDGVRGTDAAGRRAGPMRLVGSGAASPPAVKRAAFACFFLACCLGLVLAAVTSWWIVAAGALCVLAAWFYTGGSHPYGYRGLGEVSVFAFFGVAAVAGTAYVQMGRLSWLGLAASVPAGLLSCALLMVNNLRDIRSDATSGKRTLAVRIGDSRARQTYQLFLLVPFALGAAIAVYRPFALIVLLALPLAIVPVRAVRAGVSGPGLIATLGQTGRLQLAFGVAFTVGLAIHALPACGLADSSGGPPRADRLGRAPGRRLGPRRLGGNDGKRAQDVAAAEIRRPQCSRLPGLPQPQAITCG
jgi:1,4-dihydroxy-2-naphthoate octaprenyltransferase